MDRVGICNLALGWVGAQAITSLDDDSTQAQLCLQNYEAARDAVLVEKDWTFAAARYALAAYEDPPAFTWAARHLLPPEVLQVRGVDDGSDAWRVAWEREGRFILSDVAGELRVRATVRVESEAEFHPAFVQVLALRLASVLVVPLSENRALQADLWALYLKALAKAGGVEGMQGSPKRFGMSRIAARRL